MFFPNLVVWTKCPKSLTHCNIRYWEVFCFNFYFKFPTGLPESGCDHQDWRLVKEAEAHVIVLLLGLLLLLLLLGRSSLSSGCRSSAASSCCSGSSAATATLAGLDYYWELKYFYHILQNIRLKKNYYLSYPCWPAWGDRQRSAPRWTCPCRRPQPFIT